MPPGHGLLKILKAEAVIVCPSTSKTLATFRFKSLKRFGTCNDILWFEICPCTKDNPGLYFFSIGSGIDVCDQIANTIKNLLQNLTKQHLVFNNAGSEGPNFSAPKHYSCPGAAPLSQVSFIASMRKGSIISLTSSSAPRPRKFSASSTVEESCNISQRSTTFSLQASSSSIRSIVPLVKQPSVTSCDGTSRTTLSNFRQGSVVSLEGSTPLSKFRQGSIDSSIPESPSRNRSGSSTAVKHSERKDSGVFDEEGLSQSMSKVSVSPQNSDSSSDRAVTAMDLPGVTSSPYVNYYSPSQPLSSPSGSDSPPISPHITSLPTVPEQPTSMIKDQPSQVPPVAPPRSLISLLGSPSKSSSKC